MVRPGSVVGAEAGFVRRVQRVRDEREAAARRAAINSHPLYLSGPAVCPPPPVRWVRHRAGSANGPAWLLAGDVAVAGALSPPERLERRSLIGMADGWEPSPPESAAARGASPAAEMWREGAES